jgi:hypothetical protein
MIKQKPDLMRDSTHEYGLQKRTIMLARSYAYHAILPSLNSGSQKKRRLRARQRGIV